MQITLAITMSTLFAIVGWACNLHFSNPGWRNRDVVRTIPSSRSRPTARKTHCRSPSASASFRTGDSGPEVLGCDLAVPNSPIVTIQPGLQEIVHVLHQFAQQFVFWQFQEPSFTQSSTLASVVLSGSSSAHFFLFENAIRSFTFIVYLEWSPFIFLLIW